MQRVSQLQERQRRMLVLAMAGAALLIIVAIVMIIPSLGATTSADTVAEEEPVVLEPVVGTDLQQVILSEHAMQRLGIETAPARAEQMNGEEELVVPYASILYDTEGDAWVYTSPEPNVFVRQSVTIDSIDGDLAILSEGPDPGTQVATVGVAELFGSEFGVGH